MPISHWYFLAGFLICSTVAVMALRDNNLTAINLRNQVLAADKADGNVAGSLNTLRQYVYSHMNTNLASGPNSIYPPIQLKYTYQRLENAQQSQVSASNSQIYTDAENYCQSLIPVDFSGRTRVPCIQYYVTTHEGQNQTIPAALYEYDFVSPFWSPDLAGWSIVASVIFLILFAVRLFLEKWVNHRRRESS